MTDALPPAYEIADMRHIFTWPDQVALVAEQPSFDTYGRLWCTLAAYGGPQLLLNHSQLDLLSDSARKAFVQTCLSVNGHVAWLPRLLFVAHHVDTTLKQPQRDAPAAWSFALGSQGFATQPDPFQENPFVHDLLYPGCITFLAAPRGTGKSHVAVALFLAAASGGVFRGEQMTPARILLADRDNPPALLRRRLRSWGVSAAANTGKVLARDHAPSLRQPDAWQHFPVADYDALLVDSWQSFTEGISEKEPGRGQDALTVLKDLARRGPAILVLDNTIKSGESYRGRGEKADMIDILYEIRDCTNWTPSAPEHWWESLPEAGEKDWQQRATRHQQTAVLRLAFVPSKFRLDVEPEPFILELDLRTPPWTLRDVTALVVDDALQTSRLQAAATRDAVRRAITALAAEVTRQAHAGTPLTKQKAEAFLMNQGVSQRQARLVLRSQAGTDWVFMPRPDLHEQAMFVMPMATP